MKLLLHHVNIFRRAVGLSAILVLLLPAGISHGGRILIDSPGNPYSGRTKSGLEVVGTSSGQGWRATTTQEEEVETGVEQALEYPNIFLNPQSGTLDLLVQRIEPVGQAVKYEALASFENPAVRAPYPFEAAFYVVWNSNPDGKSILMIDSWGDSGKKVGSVWGGHIPFPFPVNPGDRVHIRITWGGGGSASNRIYFNGQEAGNYYMPNGETISPRTGALSAFLPPTVHLKVGNSLQSPISGTVLYGIALFDEVLDTSTPFGGERPVIASITDDTFKVAGISGKLVAGDKVSVELVSAPGGKASFDFGKVKGIAMEEVPATKGAPGVPAVVPGTYRGTYTIQPGDDFEDGRIVGKFVTLDNVAAEPATSSSMWTIDTKPVITFRIDRKDLPADSSTKARIKLIAKDGNGNPVQGRHLKLTLSTTDEYTGTVGAGDFGQNVGATVETRWRGETDAWGEVEFDYLAGFAAKTVILSAKDLDSGGVTVDYITAYKEASIDIALTPPISRTAARRGIQYIVKVEASRTELTADGRGRSVIRAQLLDPNGTPVAGDPVTFTLSSENGTLRTIQGTTDSSGTATAEYTSGKKIGIVVVTATATLRNAQGNVSITLLSDAPAKIILKARPDALPADGFSRSDINVKVTDINDNPNADTKVEFRVAKGGGKLDFADRVTDRFGDASNRYTAGTSPGTASIVATVRSKVPTQAELAKARNVLFAPYSLEGDEIRLGKWLKKKGDSFVKGDILVVYTVGRSSMVYQLTAPFDGMMGEQFVEYWDTAEVGQTLAVLSPK